jgi:hypothetical protein
MIVGVRFKIFIPSNVLLPALLSVLRENEPDTPTSFPLFLKYCAKNSILIQAALANGLGICKKKRILIE